MEIVILLSVLSITYANPIKSVHEDIAYFTATKGNKIEALLGTLNEDTPRNLIFSEEIWKPLWEPGLPSKLRSIYLQWYTREDGKNCTQYPVFMEYCFYNFTFSQSTKTLYNFYRKTVRPSGWIGFRQTYLQPRQIDELQSLTQKTSSFEYIDFLILTKCLSSFPIIATKKQLRAYLNITSKIFSHKGIPFGSHLIWRKLERILRNYEQNFSWSNDYFFISIWRPFSDKTVVTGMSLYKNGKGNLYQKPINYNKTSKNINENNLEMAAYVPLNFLKKITLQLSNQYKKNLTIIMVFVVNNNKYRDFLGIKDSESNVVGVSIPGFCKQNDSPMISVYLKRIGSDLNGVWKNFGAQYYDDIWTDRKCLLSQVSFFSFSTSSDGYHESAKEKFCIPDVPVDDFSDVDWSTTPVGKVALPRELCVNEDLHIPAVDCEFGGVISQRKSLDLECYRHPLSSTTVLLYQLVLYCYRQNFQTDCYNNITLLERRHDSYVDVELSLLLLHGAMYSQSLVEVHMLHDLINKGMELLENIGNPVKPISNINTLLSHCLRLELPYEPGEIFIRPKSIHTTLNTKEGDTIGIVIYENHNKSFANSHVKPLTRENYTDNNTSDWEVSLHFSTSFVKSINKYDENDIIDVWVIHNNAFEEGYFRCRSRVLWIANYAADFPFEFDLYLKTVLLTHPESYRSTITIQPYETVVACVSAEIDHGEGKFIKKIYEFRYENIRGEDIGDATFLLSEDQRTFE